MVSGKVTDGQLPISGANVLIKNTNSGVVTDFDGRFTITARPSDTLQISYLGYTTLTIPINNRSTINVTLQEDATALGEVQINAGYYSTTDREKTGSIARITAKDIELQPVNNPLGAMQGYMSGVNIVQNTGVPGGGYDIQIRGKNFINGGTDPLFIVDGVPFSSQSLSAQEVSGQILGGNISPLNAIHPNDIESIEVLKDADATAIYGSRGANGVVLITTKKGTEGKTQVKVNLSNTLSQVSHFLDLMDTDQYLEVRREGVMNDGFGAFLDDSAFDFIWPDIKSWDNGRYTDWQKVLIGGTANRTNSQVSVSGGHFNTRFLISGAHQKETTVFPGDANYKKTSLHSNIVHSSDTDRLTINFNTIYTKETNSLPRSDFTFAAYTLEPNAPALFDETGQLNWENNTWNNPLASLQEQYEVKINALMVNAIVSYELIHNLKLKTNLGFNQYRLNAFRTLPSSATNPAFGYTPQNYASTSTNGSDRQSWIVEPQLNYTKQWTNARLDILLGTTFQQETTQQLVLKGTGFPNNQLLENLAAAEIVKVLRDADSKYSYNAVFGRLNLNLFDTFILNLTGRRDGSSRFGPGKQFGNFGAVGIAWLFSEETMFKGTSWLSFGKLRTSFGSTGSDNIGDYKFLSTYDITGFDYNGTPVLQPTGLFNPLFGWESNQKLEVALEIGFFKDRWRINTSWHRNHSSNQLIGIPLAATTGFSELTGNFDATVENTGVEIDLNTVNFQNSKFKWSTTFNLSVPKNRLVAFEGLESSTFANRLIIGKPIGITKLYHALGVDTETGVYQFEDYNGDGAISQEDKQWVADLSPKFYGGLGNTVTYGNFTLDVFLQFKKQKAYNELAFVATPGYRGNGSVVLLDRWQQPGDIRPIQTASSGLSLGEDTNGQQVRSSATISDASFVRLRNVSLNYKIPYLSKSDMEMNVFLQGQNLLTFTRFTGPDPEQSTNTILPPLRQITVGLQLTF
jgi:TonB-linked SusC/RagA family outer membrane protein